MPRPWGSLLVVVALSFRLGASEPDAPDLIIHHAVIWPGKSKELNHQATALAIRQGRIIAMGTDAEILSLQQPSTRVIDARGQRL
ncbi:MAG TPA: hypothetical protein PKA06_10850, partial [Gemmatales bacterium]|nr:hypothetical protein [Gemmatales bacterium]